MKKPVPTLLMAAFRCAPSTMEWIAKKGLDWNIFGPISEMARLAQFVRSSRSGNQPLHQVFSEGWNHQSVQDVEVLITAFRYREFLPRAIESAKLALKYALDHGRSGGIAVIEDCGRDGSWEWLCDCIQDTSIPMRIIQPHENIGLVAARNMVLNSSPARTLFVLDADNTVDKSGLLRLIETLSQSSSVAAYGKLRVIDSNGTHVRDVSDKPLDRQEMLEERNHIDAMALYDRAALKAAGGWDATILEYGWGMEDYMLWIQWLVQGKEPLFVLEYIGDYFMKPDSMSRIYNTKTESRLLKWARWKYYPLFKVGAKAG